MGIISYILGSDNRKHLKKLENIAIKIELLREKYANMSDEELRGQTQLFRDRLNNNYETLDDILPEAFAVVREASTRVLGMTHFHVQLLGGIALHQGRIAEMRTGEGKTLVSTLPAYLNALSGKGVHIVTVNDYLAQRDADWMGKIHRFLGLSVGVVVSGMEPDQKRAAYNCDITYCTNNELGFDYLRDNMALYKADKVQRALNFAIIDEVDSILIDEARTPLIISGSSGKGSEMYITANRFVRSISSDDYEIDEKKKAIVLTETGITKAERYFAVDNLSDLENTELNHYINNALRANLIMHRDDDYIVTDGQVLIVDEFTGRVMIGRRYSDGLHQAIEAKEGVVIRAENKTMATITFQNYFRLYAKLSGMTGTAKTEEPEFRGIYGLDVVIIPTNLPSARVDENDLLYTTLRGKLAAIVEDIAECFERGQPVLVGTTTVEKSEALSAMLKARKIPHNVLNAKHHEREAEIVAQAGRLRAITIATNMAGRGTDILLGGNPEFQAKQRMRNDGVTEELISWATNKLLTNGDAEQVAARELYQNYFAQFSAECEQEKAKVIAVGGLRILGSERHESRRIDNQLRGRAGRQGDIGSSIFYLSMEDDLLRLYGGDRMQRLSQFLRIDENTPLEMGWLTRSIANAQKSLEGKNYSIRKHVLEYDNVMNTQRTRIYSDRAKVLEGESISEQVQEMFIHQINLIVDAYVDPRTDYNEWDIEGLNKDIEKYLLPGELTFLDEERLRNWTIDEIKEYIYKAMRLYYDQKIQRSLELGVDFEEVERVVLLRIVDRHWMAHIDDMEALKRGIGLKGYGQQDPVVAYKHEGFEMFDNMIASITEETVSVLMRIEVKHTPRREGEKVTLVTSDPRRPRPAKASPNKSIGRNDPCPCGSGRKYKLCCGR